MTRPVFAAALILILALGAFAGCKQKSEPPEESAPRSPETSSERDYVFTGLDGSAVSLADYRGKVVLLEFWATWCPPCRLAIPALNNLHERFNGQGVAVLAVSVGEDREKVKRFAEREDMRFTVLVDNADVNALFGVMTIPTSFIIDREGAVVRKHMGYVQGFEESLGRDIEEFL